MYNLFFCKETKLKRKLWLQTVFHTKGRQTKWKSAHKTNVCVLIFLPAISFYVGTAGVYCCFARILGSEGLYSSWSHFEVVKWEVSDDNHKEIDITDSSECVKTFPPHIARLWLLSHLTLIEAHTLATKETNTMLSAKWSISCDPRWFCFHSCGGCPLFAIQFIRWSAY